MNIQELKKKTPEQLIAQAEELGINSQNVDAMKHGSFAAKKLLGTTEYSANSIGLPQDFAYQIIKQVGNYGEIYERTVAPIGIPRAGSVNDLWTRGGILYAPPIR